MFLLICHITWLSQNGPTSTHCNICNICSICMAFVIIWHTLVWYGSYVCIEPQRNCRGIEPSGGFEHGRSTTWMHVCEDTSIFHSFQFVLFGSSLLNVVAYYVFVLPLPLFAVQPGTKLYLWASVSLKWKWLSVSLLWRLRSYEIVKWNMLQHKAWHIANLQHQSAYRSLMEGDWGVTKLWHSLWVQFSPKQLDVLPLKGSITVSPMLLDTVCQQQQFSVSAICHPAVLGAPWGREQLGAVHGGDPCSALTDAWLGGTFPL